MKLDDRPSGDAWLETANNERIPISAALSLGRSRKNSIRLEDDAVSRRHAVLNLQNDGEFWLVDLGSKNGTHVNAQRIFQPVRLRDGDHIELSGHAFLFRQGAFTADSLETVAPSTTPEFRTESLWLLLADIENFTPMSRTLPADRLAMLVGGWFLACQKVIEGNEGRISKYLGDGLLASWGDDEASTPRIASAARRLATMVAGSEPRFRFVIHRGTVSKGGSPIPGEEALMGSAVSFVFRMEKLASRLHEPFLFSQEANTKLADHLPSTPLASHSLKGFEGDFPFFIPQFR